MKKFIIPILTIFCWALIILPTPLFSAVELYYPELTVSPRATERLAIETQRENRNAIIFNLPLQINSAMTLFAGMTSYTATDTTRDPYRSAALFGMASGAGWLLANAYLGLMHRPYSRAKAELANFPSRSISDTLMKERLAEEAINQAGDLAQKLNWFSILTNLGASVAMVSVTKNRTMGKTAAIASIPISLIPLFFDHPWKLVSRQQQSYKQKIYGPLTFTPAVIPVHLTNELAHGFILSYSF